ncbi:cytochrome C biogenesis protein [Legionella quinlivanii]|uniref:Cytochrome C biogenesis protein n=1 Tax=Legionella quinlivanii TaxID=45073 RepID=A0A0W0Y427_9GAMM|nr:DsbE family thiol:disulfide interchange protein [Legionella quinlivanii]KTD51767.1 cytochrome C biogenesis protein [Legionella quinlivanii]MCW8451104.1 DsbE family thiol:disulfide interchange protein [Legionella quinlivanii]SEF65716.1 cytochrome c biogenesis protein CcmG, thiol:disulfide interchange protein DsbE [Legionella quinlivanii DSM 21216]STY10705.1 cytochrome c biogenesis protein CcmG, thiol-disulfide interchange protein DsbE [Legionella quinlivanii]
MRKVFIRSIPFLLFVVLAAFLWKGLSLDPQKLPSARLGQSLGSFSLPPLQQEAPAFTPELFKGQIVLLNVWASWCEACTMEQLFLMHLAGQGVKIYGVNYKDNPEDARKWLKEWGNPYVAVGEDIKGNLAMDLGVYGAPETFLIDQEGIIRFRHVGILDEQSWTSEFLPRIKELEKKA